MLEVRCSGGKTYYQLSAEEQANPSDTALTTQTNLVFTGPMARGSLLEAYEAWFFGQIALYASIGCFFLALVMLVLTLLGLRHYRRIDDTTVI